MSLVQGYNRPLCRRQVHTILCTLKAVNYSCFASYWLIEIFTTHDLLWLRCWHWDLSLVLLYFVDLLTEKSYWPKADMFKWWPLEIFDSFIITTKIRDKVYIVVFLCWVCTYYLVGSAIVLIWRQPKKYEGVQAVRMLHLTSLQRRETVYAVFGYIGDGFDMPICAKSS